MAKTEIVVPDVISPNDVEAIPVAKRINLRLNTPKNVRLSLSRIADAVVNGEVDLKTANTLTLICNTILSSIRIDEQERKIDELARLLEDRAKSKQ